MERASRCRAVHLVRMQPQLVSHGVFVRLFVRPAAPVAAPLGVMVVLEHFGAFDGGVPTVGAAAPADVHANEHAHHRPEPYARAHSHTHTTRMTRARVDYVWITCGLRVDVRARAQAQAQELWRLRARCAMRAGGGLQLDI